MVKASGSLPWLCVKVCHSARNLTHPKKKGTTGWRKIFALPSLYTVLLIVGMAYFSERIIFGSRVRIPATFFAVW